MSHFLQIFRLFLRAPLLVLGMSFVTSTAAIAANTSAAPLVIIRFNQPRVYFDQQLYSAIEKAVAIKPDVTFDVVSYAPTSSDANNNKQWQALAGRNTRSVIAAMTQMGVPMDRIHVVGQSQPGLRYDETQIFVQ